MENASKALLIAGGILIALSVLAIAVFVFVSYRGYVISYQQTVGTTEIQKYNGNFLKFQGRKDITIQEIISLANYAPQYFEQTGVNIEIKVNKINYNGGTMRNITLKDNTTLDFIKVIQGNSTETFECTNIGYDDSGFVNKIQFTII